ncbi:MAG: replication initiator protein A [Candidatus Omnitrophica bacterium]|nr:replication initiator protein A [Candidatus Omnitrophota bacterium]
MENTIIPEKRTIIRQELNIEKWPLFAPSTYRKKSREITRKVLLENGNSAERKVTIGKTQQGEMGILRIVDYKIFCGLVGIWEEAGKPKEGKTNFAIHNLAKLLKLQWGRSTYRHIYKALERLKVVPIIWEDSFYQKESNTTERMVRYFNILDDLVIFERRAGNQMYLAFSSFKLNNKIISNLLNNHTKPLYLDEIVKLKKEISVLLYRYIDLIMADKNHFERRTQELFSDLELSEYRYPSKRKQLLAPALKELEGAELSTGIISQANLEKTTDGKDWKVVFRKSKKSLRIEHKEKQENKNTEAILAVELFNKRFPQKKGMLKEEVIEALIKKYSFDKVMLHISRISNNETVNNPVGLLKTSLEKEWDLPPTKEEIQQQEKQARDEKEKRERERQERERGEYLKTKEEEERLNKIFFSLTPEEQESLKEEARQEIIAEHMEDSQEKTSKFFLMDIMVMIKAREILREQESKNEPKY